MFKKIICTVLILVLVFGLVACTGTDDLQRQIDEWKEKASQQDEKIAGLEEKLTSSDEKIAGLETDVAGLEEDIASRDSMIAELEEELETRNGKIAELETELAVSLARIAELEEELQKKIDRITELEEELKKKNDRIAELQDELWEIVGTPGLVYRIIADGAEYEVKDYTGTNTKVYIPAFHDGKPVTRIGEESFYGKYITHVIIANNLLIIGERAFSNSSLEKVTFAEGSRLERIETDAFVCSLKSILIPLSVTYMHYETFYGAVIYAEAESAPVGWLDPIGYLRYLAYWGIHSTDIAEIDGAEYLIINDSATLTRYVADGKTFSIPASVSVDGKTYSVTNIGIGAFARCHYLMDITIPSSVITIGDSAFSNCWSLTNVTIPDSVTSIGDEAFYDCSLTNIIIPDSVTSIGHATFLYCISLTSVVIPSSVTSIGGYAFGDCDALTVFMEASSKSDDWGYNWNGGRPVVWGCTLSKDNAYVMSFTKTATSVENTYSSPYPPYAYHISSPQRAGYTFAGWNTAADGSGKTYPLTTNAERDSIPNGTTLYAIWVKN